MYGRRLFPNYYFFWQRQAIRFGDDKSTQQFLSQFKDNSFAIAGLRSLLSESWGRLFASRLTDDQVLTEVAKLILSGELELVSGLTPRNGGSSSTQRPGDPAPPLAGSPPGPGTRSEEPESDTFPSGMNPLLQAAVLSAAAAKGAPFCPQ